MGPDSDNVFQDYADSSQGRCFIETLAHQGMISSLGEVGAQKRSGLSHKHYLSRSFAASELRLLFSHMSSKEWELLLLLLLLLEIN